MQRSLILTIFSLTASSVGAFLHTDQVCAQEKKSTAKIESAVILGSKNTSIRFVGTHTGKDPEPQLGGFGSFDGYLKVDETKKKITGLSVSISVDSLWTEIGELTRHLKNADFFDAKKFPVARFSATKIQYKDKENCTISGTLNLHGKSHDISIPAKTSFSKGKVRLVAKFQIDRTKFGIGKPMGGISQLVSVKIEVGTPTHIPPEKEDDDDDEDE